MLVILSGPSTVGKSYCISQFTSKFDFETVVPFTTRSPRQLESEGVHYHYVSKTDLETISNNFSKGYWIRPFDEHYYGYTQESIDKLPEDSENWIIHADTRMALQIKNRFRTGVYTVFIDYQTEDKHLKRLQERFNADELQKRLQHDKEEKANKGKFDTVIESDDLDIITQELFGYLSTLVVQPLHSEHVYPGTLSDVEILRSIRDPNGGIRVEGITEEELENRVQGWTLDLTLDKKYFRVKKKFFRFRIFDLAYSNQKDVTERFPDKAVNQEDGIVLKRGEFILGLTVEKITLPKNIVGLVSGRSSYARAGITIEFSQNVLQSGHSDCIPLQIKNNLPYPVRIYPGTGIAQVIFFKTTNQTNKMYERQFNPKYIGRNHDYRSRIYDDPVHEKVKEIKKNLPIKWHKKIFDKIVFEELIKLVFTVAGAIIIAYLVIAFGLKP